MDKGAIFYWAALWRLPRVGPKKFIQILKAFGSPKAFFDSNTTQQQVVGLNLNSDQLSTAKTLAELDIRWLEKDEQNHILLQTDKSYPKSLLVLDDAPPILYVKGVLSSLSMPQIAIVGSRNASYEGLETARLFACYLADAGISVTSGMALGIDSAAHSGALQSNTVVEKTIAVMGTGLDTIYPKSNKALAHKILDNGAIVSELPIGSPVTKHAFPKRNRIISGLSLGTLVVEASLKSGSLITARTALSQNKEVFAIPGSIHNPMSKGCNDLIKSGAKLVETVSDILEEIKPQLLNFVEIKKSDRLIANRNLSAEVQEESLNCSPLAEESFPQDNEHQSLWQALSYEPQSVEELAARSDLSLSAISSMLLIMELSGNVIKLPGGRYQKKSI